jgi:hypothetical protein
VEPKGRRVTELKLYSVTTLIKEGLGTGKGLVYWNAHTPAAWAADHLDAFTALVKVDRDQAIKTAMDARWTKSGKAAARGTDLHAAAEQLALGQQPDVAEEILPYVDQYIGFLEKHEPEFLMSEAPVYAPAQQYAGTCDGIMVLGGKTVIFDIKTTDKGLDAKSRPPYAEVALQLAAYSRAELVGILSEKRESNYGRYYVYSPDQHHEPMPAVDGAVCIVVSPFDCRVVPVRIDDEVFRAFLHVRECARWQIDISKRVLGPEITTAAVAA